MKNNLLIGVLGHQNSGKSKTWYYLFEDTVKTGYYIRQLYLTKTEYVEVFLINGSPEETGIYVGERLDGVKARIVLCSMQYTKEVTKTIDYFSDNDYFLYIQWLNPGHKDQNDIGYFDYLGIMNFLLALDSTVSIRNGKNPPEDRVQEIADYIYGWASSRNLIHTIET